jgi:hypothetical protein
VIRAPASRRPSRYSVAISHALAAEINVSFRLSSIASRALLLNRLLDLTLAAQMNA